MHPGVLLLERSIVHCLEASIQLFHREVSTAQGAINAVEDNCDQNHLLIYPEVRKRHDLEEMLAEERRYLNDHSSLVSSSKNLFCYDVNRGLQD